MRIAQVAPLHEAVPPIQYGGTERVVHFLTEELVRRGHDVTLFASGDSRTSAELYPIVPRSLRRDNFSHQHQAAHALELELVARHAHRFDVIHFHVDCLQFPLMRRMKVPHVTTFHGRLDFPYLPELMAEFDDIPVISISDSQRRPIPHANWISTVFNGFPRDLCTFQEGPREYLAFLGRICPEKGPDLAIEIAKRVGLPLKIAAKVDREFQDYFDSRIRPHLNHPLIEFIGEIGDKERNAFLGGAKALVFPIQWPEPFGLAMTEALACGTPVVAFRKGSVPEIIQHGRTGFIVHNVDEAVAAVTRLDELQNRDCRDDFEHRFTVECMTDQYLAAYRRVAGLAEPRPLLVNGNGRLPSQVAPVLPRGV